jgi:hypothetical protein
MAVMLVMVLGHVMEVQLYVIEHMDTNMEVVVLQEEMKEGNVMQTMVLQLLQVSVRQEWVDQRVEHVKNPVRVQTIQVVLMVVVDLHRLVEMIVEDEIDELEMEALEMDEAVIVLLP